MNERPTLNVAAPKDLISTTIQLDSAYADVVLGSGDSHLRVLSNLLDADLFVRDHAVRITGPANEVKRAVEALRELESMARRGHVISDEAVKRVVQLLRAQTADKVASISTTTIISRRGKAIRPQTMGQKRYVDAIDNNTIVFGIGPAGSGKTYLAVAKAVQALQTKQVSRIILTRPAVEAGEKLGFLPGTLDEKIDPYLRPLYDALRDMLDPEMIPQLMDAGVIEVAPLAYMRGRTLSDSFVILDEAQNTTAEQMKMFLTRLGFGTTMVITGDATQVDLPRGTRSGLRVVREILEGVDGLHFADLDASDVVRHQLVGKIVQAYADYEARSQKEK